MNSVRMIATLAGVGVTAGRGNFAGSYNRNVVCWPAGVLGYSFTQFTGPQSFAINVYANVMGSSQVIAGVTGVITTASGFMTIAQMSGTTQWNFIGIPTPVQAILTGQSAAAGTTGVCVVTAALYSPT